MSSKRVCVDDPARINDMMISIWLLVVLCKLEKEMCVDVVRTKGLMKWLKKRMLVGMAKGQVGN